MGILQNERTLDKIYLRTSHIFGRNPSKSDTILINNDASQIHASIRWDGKAWEIIDHSRNGTMVDGKRIPANTRLTLKIGQKIRFALGSMFTWVVESLDPPSAMLLPPQEGAPAVRLNSFNLLPDEMSPQASVYLSPTGQWIWEESGTSVFLQDGDTVLVGENEWKFVCSPEIETTSDKMKFNITDPGDALLNFTVSQNEEHISLSISESGKSVDLGERTHHYSLLTLARRRLDDANRGIESSSQGWIDIGQLSRMLGLDPSHLNIQIFRARNQIARAFHATSSLTNIVERRRGEVRFGSVRFQIVRGSSLEGTFNPSLFVPMIGQSTHAAPNTF